MLIFQKSRKKLEKFKKSGNFLSKFVIFRKMGAESEAGLDDLMMGNASENARESDEKIQARIAAAQAKIAKIKRDEKKSKNFDAKLAKILPKISMNLLDFVIFLIDREVPSLTILAMISCEVDEAGKICFSEFGKHVQERADFSTANFEDKKIEDRISWWWTFIFAADHVSNTTKLRSFRENSKFVTRISSEFAKMLDRFLGRVDESVKFDPVALKKGLKKYADQVFSDNPLGNS